MSNRLAQESSPYLLQHAENPVDWYPWGPEALETARREDKPIFLSVGYAACHWCHVMEHESFENEQIAEQLNEHFVCIKVDREERPDLDHLYMNALQIYLQMVGSPQGGGWPLSMFLTPELQPFFGGTYWPPDARYGRPGFMEVLGSVHKFWTERRSDTLEQGQRITQYLREMNGSATDTTTGLSSELLDQAESALERQFDARHGGFGGAPKFPHSTDLRLLLRRWQRSGQAELLKMVRATLDHMAGGGLYDQLGGGFHRYSVDAEWLVPHFEKMLYDNAQLVRCYAEAYQVTGDENYARVVRETCDYVLREMTHAQGAFFSTQDADSEGVEGKFYVWTAAEIREVLGEQQAQRFNLVFSVSEQGNFEGKSILHTPRSLADCAQQLQCDEAALRVEIDACRKQLLEVRSKRIWPGLDDKVLTSWNALMVDAMAYAAGAVGEPRYLAAAQAAADFVLTEMRQENGRLYHAWRNGEPKLAAYLDDYTTLIDALVTLYEATFEERYLDEALRLTDDVLEHFADAQQGGFFFTADDHEELVARYKDAQDSPVPSGNAMAATCLLRLAQLSGREDLRQAGEATLASQASFMQRAPTAAGQMLLALDLYLGPARELVLIADAEQLLALAGEYRRQLIPRTVLAGRIEGAPQTSAALEPIFAGKKPASAATATAWLCTGFACQAPSEGGTAIEQLIQSLASGSTTSAT